MTRYAILAVVAGLALLAFIALFYVVGVAVGLVAFAVLGVALIGALLYGSARWKLRSRGGPPAPP